MSDKEKAQLLDLHEDWGKHLITDVWEWNKGASPPLRLMVEFVISARAWLGSRLGPEFPIHNEGGEEEVLDWARVWPASVLADSDSSPYTPVERQVYFGWHWDALDSIDISIATKADDAKVDLSLWNVGGDAPGMEDARGKI